MLKKSLALDRIGLRLAAITAIENHRIPGDHWRAAKLAPDQRLGRGVNAAGFLGIGLIRADHRLAVQRSAHGAVGIDAHDIDPIFERRDIIFDLSQTALDLNYDGLMIETHHDPDNAWSDAAQQITPDTLIKYTEDLRIRKEVGEAAEFKNKINTLRTKIDVIDHQLIEILGKRMQVVEDIGSLKKKHNVAVLQNKRWNEILGKMILEGEEKNLSEEFILRMFKAIHQESINHQEEIINH